MAVISNVYVFLLIYLFGIISVFSPLETTASNGIAGFTANLIHRDSPISPLYNPKDSYFYRLRNSFYRSIVRANHFKPNSVFVKALQSDIIHGGGEYFMRISIGTPSVELLAIADTGSDLIWVQCQPCDLCYQQKSPIFDPRRSSSYRQVSCGSRFCNALDSEARVCSARGIVNDCGYTYSYGDHSFTDGHLATERFTIGSTNSNSVPLQPVALGCGTRNGGTFDEVGSGIIGLGGGSLSLISQLSSKISGRFSYCLVPTSEQSNYSTSKINFGIDMLMSDPDLVAYTPLVSKEPDTFYYLTLEAISVGNMRLAYKNSWNKNVQQGNIIIDSGTTLTFLDSEFYNELESAMEEVVKAERVSDPQGIFNICFRDSGDVDLPIITAHFTNADVELQPVNTFAKAEEKLLCLTMIPSNGIAIFGNLAQMNFLIGYDLEKSTVFFMPTDCAKQS
ncbi:aspartic proteinase CDR1-like [Hevea brasiliensis]|uniref:aspartic proteinase CDR1-like n=1 Tax=Hevea brasiliensis TaxID=3981 RepID=UPI0025D90929|nr:aspartic proteinase CDR1-like [Hevea brasiliensis]